MTTILKTNGLHLYINIKNYDDIIEAEEGKTKKVNHCIHALDSFFSEIERYTLSNYKNTVIEKITGSRLHIQINYDEERSLKIAWEIAKFSKTLATYINKKVSKYSMLEDFILQFGADYGDYYNLEIQESNIDEITSIGYAANFAAKLQTESNANCLSISKYLFDCIKNIEIKEQFKEVKMPEFNKYEQSEYYFINMRENKRMLESTLFTDIFNRINSTNLSDIEFSNVKDKINFDNISKNKSKIVNGVLLFVDIRGFTKLFDKEDKNLDYIKNYVIESLQKMYLCILNEQGIHIQFQGDREMAIFHDFGSNCAAKNSIIAALKLMGAFNSSIKIGVGMEIGKLFVTKLGARGYKDNIVLGRTITNADTLEDKCANEGEIVISEKLYKAINTSDSVLASLFQKRDYYFYTRANFQDYLRQKQFKEAEKNKIHNKYLGAYLNDKI